MIVAIVVVLDETSRMATLLGKSGQFALNVFDRKMFGDVYVGSSPASPSDNKNERTHGSVNWDAYKK